MAMETVEPEKRIQALGTLREAAGSPSRTPQA
jgi:hypothetical protein